MYLRYACRVAKAGVVADHFTSESQSTNVWVEGATDFVSRLSCWHSSQVFVEVFGEVASGLDDS